MAKNLPEKAKVEATHPQPKLGLKSYAGAALRLGKSWLGRHRRFVWMAIVILVVLGGFLMRSLLTSDSVMTNDEIVIRVGQDLSISGDPNPAILTVEDEAKVSQPFLDEAKNGDKILLYYKAKKAVLFRPSERRVVRHGTYTPPDPKVFIRKGTADDAKVAAVKQKLESLEALDLVSQDISTKQDYPTTLVVSVTDRYDEAAKDVAGALNGTIVRLPKGETIPDADILVIVGAQ